MNQAVVSHLMSIIGTAAPVVVLCKTLARLYSGLISFSVCYVSKLVHPAFPFCKLVYFILLLLGVVLLLAKQIIKTTHEVLLDE